MRTRCEATDYDTSYATDAQANNEPVEDVTNQCISLGRVNTLGTRALSRQEYVPPAFGVTYHLHKRRRVRITYHILPPAKSLHFSLGSSCNELWSR